MTDMDLPQIQDKHLNQVLKTALEASAEACKIHRKYYGNLTQVSEKLDEGLVSEADRESEHVIRKIMRRDFPNVGILGEEEGYKGGSNTNARWVVDPLDGTTNYVHRFPFFCTSIAFEENNQVQVGVIEATMLNKTYFAVRGSGAYCNGQAIHVSRSQKLSDCLYAVGLADHGTISLERKVDVIKKISKQARGLRRTGSAALELALVAEGVFDGYWEYALSPWDMAAGSLLVEEAGGVVTDEDGNPYSSQTKSIFVGSTFAHAELLKL